jgi:hypothetical protein
VEIELAQERLSEGVRLRVLVRLTPRETNRLFLSGDTLIQLPLDGVVAQPETAPIARTSIFLSELAGSNEGFTRTFVDEARADAFAAAVRTQIESALEGA